MGPLSMSLQQVLTYETPRFTASFPEFSSSDFGRRNSQTLCAESMSSRYILHVETKPNPARQKSAYYNQNPNFSGQNRLLDNCLSYIHLIMDILTPDTTCPLVFPFDWLFRTHSTEKRSQAAKRGEDAARSQAAAQRRVRRTSICPWARARGREDAAGPERITAPIAAPFHTHIWQSYSGSFPHITQLDTGRGNFFRRSVRKDSKT